VKKQDALCTHCEKKEQTPASANIWPSVRSVWPFGYYLAFCHKCVAFRPISGHLLKVHGLLANICPSVRSAWPFGQYLAIC